MSIKTLVINPGSTSTKVGVFEDETLLFEETLRHPTEEIAKYASVIDQKDFRKEIILHFLQEKHCDPHSLDVIVGRGGLLKPIPGGTYAVSDELLADLKKGVQGHRTVGAMLRNAFCFCSVSSSCPLFHKIVSGKTGEGFQKDLQDVIHVFAHYLKDVLYAQGGPLFVPAVVVRDHGDCSVGNPGFEGQDAFGRDSHVDDVTAKDAEHARFCPGGEPGAGDAYNTSPVHGLYAAFCGSVQESPAN